MSLLPSDTFLMASRCDDDVGIVSGVGGRGWTPYRQVGRKASPEHLRASPILSLPPPFTHKIKSLHTTTTTCVSCACRFEAGLYDRVLLDAPCSSERHVVQAALEAGGVVSSSSWSRAQCSNLAALQLKVSGLLDTCCSQTL